MNSLFPDYTPTPESRPSRPKGTPERQRPLLSGLDCLPDQIDLFDVDGPQQATQTTTGHVLDVDGARVRAAWPPPRTRKEAYRQGFRRLIDALDRTRLFTPAEIREIIRRCNTPTAANAINAIDDLYRATFTDDELDKLQDTLTEGT